MADYTLTSTSAVVRNTDGAHVPADPANSDWRDYLNWLADGGVPDPYVPPPPPTPAPESISDRQFFQQLAIESRITEAEALAAVKTGDIPASLQAFIDALPAEEQFAATMLLSGATVFYRSHPLTAAIGAAQGMSPAAIDEFFRAADAL